MDASLDDTFIKDAPESDEDLDAFNSDTFGDGNDHWDWDSQQEPENLPLQEDNTSHSNKQLHSSILHSSKGQIPSLPPLPDVSVIRSVADLEKDFLRESTGSTQSNISLDSTPKTLDRAILSIDPSKVFHLSDLEETMRRDSEVINSPSVESHNAPASSSLPLHSSNLSCLRPLPDMSTIKSVSEIEADLLASSNKETPANDKAWPQGGKSLDEIESELFGLNLNSSNASSASTRSPTKPANTSNNNSLSVFPNLADSSIWAPPEYSSLFPPLGSDAVTPSPVDSRKVNAQCHDPRTAARASGDPNSLANAVARNMSPMAGKVPQGQLPTGQAYPMHLVHAMPGMNPMPPMMPIMPVPGIQGSPGPLPVYPMMNARPQFIPMPVRPGMPLIPLLPNGQRFPLPMAPIHAQSGPAGAIRQLFPSQIHHSSVQMVNTNSCQPQVNDATDGRNTDQYAGLMTQDERKWLTKIQRLQLEGSMSDPYVDDYYSMAYQAKKIEQSKSRENKLKNRDPVMIVEVSNKNTPMSSRNVHADTSHVSTPNNSSVNQRNSVAYTPRQYEGSLGKLQAVNLKCPRKLLDLPSLEEVTNDSSNTGHIIDESAPLAKKELRKLRLLLLDIERLYLILLKIDYLDKRMAALPEEGQRELAESRKALCQQLFDGITMKATPSPEQSTPSKPTGNEGRSQQLKMLLDTMTKTKLAQKAEASIDLTSQSRPKLHPKISSIRKGATLIFRSLSIFRDAHHKAVLIADLIDSSNFPLVVLQKDKSLYGLDYAEIVIDALISLEESVSVDVLLLLSQGLNDASNVARYPCGEEIIHQILHLSSVFLEKCPQQITPDFAQRWEAFLLELTDEVDDVPDLRKRVQVQLEQVKAAHASFTLSLSNGSPLRTRNNRYASSSFKS